MANRDFSTPHQGEALAWLDPSVTRQTPRGANYQQEAESPECEREKENADRVAGRSSSGQASPDPGDAPMDDSGFDVSDLSIPSPQRRRFRYLQL